MKKYKKYASLDEIISDKDFHKIEIPYMPPSTTKSEKDRLIDSFEEINTFYVKNGRTPKLNNGISEMQLYSRLNSLRENPDKISILKEYDRFNLLEDSKESIKSLDDILNNDPLNLLEEDPEGLFEFKHIKKQDERASADFVAKRTPCEDFEKYKPLFQNVQKDLKEGKRKLEDFKEIQLKEKQFFVYNGVLLLLDKLDVERGLQYFKSGSRIRQDGRTRCIFENGTESNLLFRSLAKVLYANGKFVTQNQDQVKREVEEKLSGITEEDVETGIIYIAKSKSQKEEIRSIKNLYKIGFSKIPIAERIKNAKQDPTFLMEEVQPVSSYKCLNVNPQKLEQLLHKFFGNSCLNLDIFDDKGSRHAPREWFIAPLDIIEKAVELIISGEVLNYCYDPDREEIVFR